MFDHEPIFGKIVIETLSEGLYDNPLFLFREYVQNSADAIDSAIHQGILGKDEGQVEIVLDAEKRLITFEDNGTGIPHNFVKTMLANIGDSQKDRRTDKGFRGIGRLGGLGYCQKVRFETSVRGEKIKSVLEWDARNLHEILANKNEKIHAGQLIKRITSTWEEEYPAENHFFKVSLINVNESSGELLDMEEVRKYLQMVAPVPFDYAKFPFVEKIDKFIKDEGLPSLHEYRLNLNGDEIRKGYETPLSIGDGKTIDILDIECRLVQENGKFAGWYWYCISKFEGVLPKKCWQRNIRLRKANIQIGEADCLSNHPKRGDSLWREDRGNSYFIGETHALDEDLIPNSRRDYFNQNEACRRFEALLQQEFLNLHQLYHNASTIRSAYSIVHEANVKQKEFEVKEKKGDFFDIKERDRAKTRVEASIKKAEDAKRAIEKIESKLKSTEKDTDPLVQVVDIYRKDTEIDSIRPFKPDPQPKQGYIKSEISKSVKNVLDIVFEILNKMLPEDEAAVIREAIIKKVTSK
jgi:molecular chaperone HtpG